MDTGTPTSLGTSDSAARTDPPRAPAGSARQGLWILVLSLTVLFGAALVLYVAARTGVLGHIVRSGEAAPRVSLPVWLWFSTLFILASSVALHQALQWARMNLPVQARRGLVIALGLGYAFLVLQIPGLLRLVDAHRAGAAHNVRIYLLVLFLVALHALHVMGGIVPMTSLVRRSTPATFDASGTEPLRNMAIYWHFLAGVWIVMFSVFVLVR